MRPSWAQALALVLSVGASSSALGLGVKSVGSVEKDTVTQVTVVFDGTVDPTSAQALANYTLAGATIQSAVVITGLPAADAIGNTDNVPTFGRVVDNQSVVLTVNGTLTGNQTLTLRNVQGTDGTTLAETTRAFTPSGYKWADVGAPANASHVLAIGTDGFDIYSNGTAQWDVYDEGVLIYKEETGDFDVRTRVEFQDTSSQWARTGIMMREALNVGEARAVQTGDPANGVEGTASRLIHMRAHPTRCFLNAGAGIGPANNQFESTIRSVTAGNYSGIGASTPGYPNAWVRVQRIGSNVITYWSNDGVEWTEIGNYDGWDGPFFVGPSYFPEVNNINTANGDEVRGRRFLSQLRFTEIATPLVQNVQGTPLGFVFDILDAATATLVANSLEVTWNGVVTPVNQSKTGSRTTVSFLGATPIAPGTTNQLVIEYTDSQTVVTSREFTVITPNYPTVPPSYKVATATTRGFRGAVYQMLVPRGPGDANSTQNAEQQWSRGFFDPLTGEAYPNDANPADEFVTDVINTLDTGAADGIFENGLPTPGIPGNNFDNGKFVVQYWGYMELARGAYRLAVNSDDGFKFSVFSGGPDPFGLKLGEFSGGRGMGEVGTVFDFFVEEAGFYPVRLLYWQGNGGGGDNAACEFYSINLATGERILVNDPGNAAAVKVFTTGAGTAYIESLIPHPNYAGVNPDGPIQVVLRNGTTTVDTASISLTVDGQTVTPTVTSAAGTTTVTYRPATAWAFNSVHTGQFSYRVTGQTEPRVIPLSFTVKTLTAADLPATSFWIEAEDYDHSNGQSVPSASVMPYYGGEYQDLPAVLNVDYFNADGNDSDNYRPDTAPNNVNIASDLGATAAPRPGDVTMITNYKIGWVAEGDWGNYTRTIPPGLYNAYAALSFDGTAAGQLRGTLSVVTAGVGTTSQTLQQVGTFNAPGSGGWGNNVLVPMRAADGSLAVLNVASASPTTLRFTMGSGDFDHFILAPASGVPPKITSATPNNATVGRSAGTVTIQVTDFSTDVAPASIRLTYDGVDVTAQATITKAGDVTTIVYNPGLLAPNSSHTYVLNFNDTAGDPFVFNGQYMVNVLGTPGQFVIEAEDFNSNGQAQAAASVMPYVGGAYAGLPGVVGIDYASDGPADIPADGQLYRATLTPVLPINANAGFSDRGSWTVTSNFKIGWADANDWGNYTRTFPAGNYEVWAALSHGESGDNLIRASLHQVTSDPTQGNQTTQPLGTFNAPGTGGWGSNTLVPMNDANGQRAVVALSGAQTLRFQMDSGDFDYFVLLPSAVVPGPTLSAQFPGNGTLVITYSGTLESAPSLSGPWTPVAGAVSPFTVNAAAAAGPGLYYRSSN